MKLKPFLRWVGGKRWLTANYSEHFPQKYSNYIEPFLGGGAVYFFLKPKKAILNDLNSELINAYNCIKKNPEELLYLLKEYQLKHSKDYYYQIINSKPPSNLIRAASFIYLNRASFNGIYRVNRDGKFNVPYGNQKNILRENESFEQTSKILKNAKIINNDFEKIINMAKENDFLFVDPPYTVAHNNNGFVSYNEKIFSWDDQIRLFNSLKKTKNNGVKIMLTNANHSSIQELYKNDFELIEVSRYSSVSGLSAHRKKYSELIIKSY
ncbi:MAG: Dam family site-specific DNA-(adenine-N6)-methyltransferase [Sulfurimonadaceae bacterium]|nr:Dam family site-specific DNA-(adenine-N6)-methyltransferase [Sulfurimonadaceae bacterium]